VSLVVVVDGVDYPFEGINAAPIGAVRNLMRFTKGLLDPEEIVAEDGKVTLGPKFQGVSARTFQEFAVSLSDGVDPLDLYSNPSMLLHVQALIYLSKWANKETPTFDECSVPFDAIGLRNDEAEDDDEGEVEAPKDGTASDPETISNPV
jgi:hypothetical protein